MLQNNVNQITMGILFVDDEENVLHGLRRMLYPMRNEWNMFFCTSANEAMNVLSKNKIDVILSDMRMPELDGASLLKKVKELYPQVIRIILSGYSDRESAILTSGIAHQFLAKPASAENIRSTIARVNSLRSHFNNDKLLKLISGLGTLPSLPDLYTKLESEISSPIPSIKKIGELIAQDLPMTAKILQLVNSAFFGLPQQISNPVQAVNFLGLETIKSLVLFVKLFSTLNIETKLNIDAFWKHSIKVGRTAHDMLRQENMSSKILEKAFAAGMLHDLGKLILLQIPGYYENVLDTMNSNELSFHEAEYKLYGVSHSEAGAFLLGIWGLPNYLVEVLANHHNPSQLIEGESKVLAAVHIANFLDSGGYLDEQFIAANDYQDKIEILKSKIIC